MNDSWNPWRWLSTLTDIQEDFLLVGTFLIIIAIILLIAFKRIKIRAGDKEIDIEGIKHDNAEQKINNATQQVNNEIQQVHNEQQLNIPEVTK